MDVSPERGFYQMYLWGKDASIFKEFSSIRSMQWLPIWRATHRSSTTWRPPSTLAATPLHPHWAYPCLCSVVFFPSPLLFPSNAYSSSHNLHTTVAIPLAPFSFLSFPFFFSSLLLFLKVEGFLFLMRGSEQVRRMQSANNIQAFAVAAIGQTHDTVFGSPSQALGPASFVSTTVSTAPT